MNKQELMEKYHLDESHAQWQPEIDNWYSVEAFRQQTGKLPNEEGIPNDPKYHLQVYMDFLDNKKLQDELVGKDMLAFGSMYLSAKRTLYRHIEKL